MLEEMDRSDLCWPQSGRKIFPVWVKQDMGVWWPAKCLEVLQNGKHRIVYFSESSDDVKTKKDENGRKFLNDFFVDVKFAKSLLQEKETDGCDLLPETASQLPETTSDLQDATSWLSEPNSEYTEPTSLFPDHTSQLSNQTAEQSEPSSKPPDPTSQLLTSSQCSDHTSQLSNQTTERSEPSSKPPDPTLQLLTSSQSELNSQPEVPILQIPKRTSQLPETDSLLLNPAIQLPGTSSQPPVSTVQFADLTSEFPEPTIQFVNSTLQLHKLTTGPQEFTSQFREPVPQEIIRTSQHLEPTSQEIIHIPQSLERATKETLTSLCTEPDAKLPKLTCQIQDKSSHLQSHSSKLPKPTSQLQEPISQDITRTSQLLEPTLKLPEPTSYLPNQTSKLTEFTLQLPEHTPKLPVPTLNFPSPTFGSLTCEKQKVKSIKKATCVVTPTKKGNFLSKNTQQQDSILSSDDEDYLSDLDHQGSETSEDKVEDPDYELSDDEKISKEDIVWDSDCSAEFPIQDSRLLSYLDSEKQSLSEKKTITSNKDQNDCFGVQRKGQVKPGCKNVYDKVNYCTFCRKEIKSKMARHILSVHSDEPNVRGIRLLPKRSKERMAELEILINEGNFKHNIDVLRSQSGLIVVARRTAGSEPGDFLPCEFCKKFVTTKNLWHHRRNCVVAKTIYRSAYDEDEHDQDIASANYARRGRHLLQSALYDQNDTILQELFDRMQPDDVTHVVMSDRLIRRCATLKLESLGDTIDQKNHDIYRVSQFARTMARLVIEASKMKPEAKLDLDRLLSPENFDLVIEATK